MPIIRSFGYYTKAIVWEYTTMTTRHLPLLVILGCSGADSVQSTPDAWVYPCTEEWADDLCGDTCTNLELDPLHCGSCSNACFPTETCYQGACRCGVHPACGNNQECRFGACQNPDINGKSCEDDGDCTKDTFCIVGKCTSPKCIPEICDGEDNDCNGLVDDPPLALATVCYDGPTGTSGVGTCISGLQICYGGVYGDCEGQVMPATEVGILSCDGLDNDCDGCADNNYGAGDKCLGAPAKMYDIVYFIDYSSSMDDEIYSVIAAAGDVGVPFAGNDAYKFALVGVPPPTSSGAAYVLQDLDDYTVFESTLSSTGASTSGSCEPNWMGVYRALLPASDPASLGLSWRIGAVRILIVFTDEQGQDCSTANMGLVAGESGMCSMVTTSGSILGVLTYPEFYDNWDTCASLTTMLAASSSDMVDSINTILGEACD